MIQPRLGRAAPWAAYIIVIAISFLSTACETLPEAKSTLAPNNALFAEQFNPGETGQWYLESDEIGETRIEDGTLVITVNSPNTVQYSTLQEQHFSDFKMQVDAASADADSKASYGLLFRMNDQGEFYRFDITADGRFMVEKANADGSWIQFLDNWRRSESIQTGQNTWNTLRVDAVGPEMKFYINNVLVHNMSDESLSTGSIGLDLGVFDQGSASAVFDNLIIQRP